MAEIEMEDGDLTVAVDVPNIRNLSVILWKGYSGNLFTTYNQ